jgi:hypothetical protein
MDRSEIIINLPRRNWRVVQTPWYLILWAAILVRFDLACLGFVALVAGSQAALEDLGRVVASVRLWNIPARVSLTPKDWPARIAYALADRLTPKVRCAC